MGRIIPLELGLDEPTTKTCYLLKISPVTPGFWPYGVTSLDRDILFDDGEGELLYKAAIGVENTAVQFSSALSVDNSQAKSLMPVFDVPIREEDIRAGVYDFSKAKLMLANWNGATATVTIQYGTIGQIEINDEGLSFISELRGLSAQLKQTVCEKDSLSCRAIFGSQSEANSNGGVVQRFPCGFDAESLLVSGTVSAVGLENTVTFTVTPFAKAANALNPGLVVWVTGANAGRSYEIDSNTSGGVITLATATGFPIQTGDTLEYREDCTKLARDDDKGCLHWFGSNWVLHFRGEPDIPIGDAGALETPGASSGPGSGGSTYQPFSEAE